MYLVYGNEFKWENYLVAAGAGFLGGICYAIAAVGSIVSAAVTSGLTTAGQIVIRETVAGFVVAPLSRIPGYFDRAYRLNKLGLSPIDSFR